MSNYLISFSFFLHVLPSISIVLWNCTHMCTYLRRPSALFWLITMGCLDQKCQSHCFVPVQHWTQHIINRKQRKQRSHKVLRSAGRHSSLSSVLASFSVTLRLCMSFLTTSMNLPLSTGSLLLLQITMSSANVILHGLTEVVVHSQTQLVLH